MKDNFESCERIATAVAAGLLIIVVLTAWYAA